MAIATVSEIKEYKGITGSGDDKNLKDLIPRCESWLNRECRRILYTEIDTTRYMDAVGLHIEGASFHLSDFGDICQITSVTNGDGEVLTVNTHYAQYPREITFDCPTFHTLKMLGSGGKAWTYTGDMEQSISVTGRWAYYTDTTVPDDVKQMVMRLVLYALKVRDTDAFETIVIPDAGIIQAPQGFPVDVLRFVKKARAIR